jgi:hypothetical protein
MKAEYRVFNKVDELDATEYTKSKKEENEAAARMRQEGRATLKKKNLM